MPHYIAFLAYDKFVNSNALGPTLYPAPGHDDASVDADKQALLQIATSILNRWHVAEDPDLHTRLSDSVCEM
jgi:hypothetical protein